MDCINFQKNIIDLLQGYETGNSRADSKEFRFTSICESLNQMFNDYQTSEISMINKLRTPYIFVPVFHVTFAALTALYNKQDITYPHLDEMCRFLEEVRENILRKTVVVP